MQLIDIDKARYRSHLNRVIAVCIGALAAGSLGISQTLIAIFPQAGGSHFHWNLLGVVLSCLVIAWFLNRLRHNDYMTEVMYVWNLKKSLNKINRKMPKLKAAANAGNADALLAIHYSYAGSRLLWQLDDNTIIMDELVIQQAELDSLALKYAITLNVAEYEENLLAQF